MPTATDTLANAHAMLAGARTRVINCATSSSCSSICHCAQTRLANGLAPVSPLHAAACLAPLKLLVHMHAGVGFENASVLEAVLNGADGAWGGLPKRAAIIGHASLGELIANLVRVGNPHMAQTYQLDQLLPLATGPAGAGRRKGGTG
ncbi:hypothetical protein ULG90_09990 [Halopseudomonas pachastrellae]|nr:hypothetical protein ULG90_09990 [Halopseudomonas pachastrellae]